MTLLAISAPRLGEGNEFVSAIMGNGDKPASDGSLSRPEADEQPFDKWLNKQLHAMFDAVVNEPLPEDLLKAIDEDAERARHEASAADSGAATDQSSEIKRSS